jgi:hypothetical protein
MNTSPLPLIPTGSPIILSDEDRDILDKVKPYLIETMERLYVQGLAKSHSHFQQLLNTHLSIELSDDVIAYIINENLPEWIEKRTQHLKNINDRYAKLEMDLINSPLDNRHYNLLSKIELLLHAKVDHISRSPLESIGYKDLSALATISEKIINTLNSIPSVRKGNLFTGVSNSEGGRESNINKTIIERIISVTGPGRNTQADKDIEYFEDRTSEVLDKLGDDRFDET